MGKFLIMPEGLSWQEVERPVTDLETVYKMECSFYKPSHRIAVRNEDTQEVRIFSRRLDTSGNLNEIIEH
ncbi:MAG: hypothetical protein IKE93_04360 [Erysipelotrichaceae bacterium]|nr:hypothetical protein [Erysipelotrichaceae bacterium]